VIGWLIMVPLSIAAAARAAGLGESSSLLLLATGLTPLLGPPALVALGIGLWQRRRLLAVVSAATAAAHLCSALSGLGAPVGAPSLAGSLPALRLFSANVYHGNHDLGRIGQEIRATAPDLVALQELDPDGAAGLQRSGVLDRFPYAVTELRKSPSGIGLWSRLPVADSQVQDVHGMAVIKATILVGSQRLRLYTVHTVAPLGDDRVRWQAQLRWVSEEIRLERGPLVVAGDFNATRYHPSFRRLLSARLGDAHERRGRGWATTWPRDRWPLPPLMRLDHVLVSPDIGVRSVQEGLGHGSDHRPIIAELVLRSGAAAPSRLEGTDHPASRAAVPPRPRQPEDPRHRLRYRVLPRSVDEIGFRNVHASDVSELAVERLRECYPSYESRSSTSGTSRLICDLVAYKGSTRNVAVRTVFKEKVRQKVRRYEDSRRASGDRRQAGL
jgi:endonuclease/exonuclease/phosphatase (EEP) superfamily protein YafD